MLCTQVPTELLNDQAVTSDLAQQSCKARSTSTTPRSSSLVLGGSVLQSNTINTLMHAPRAWDSLRPQQSCKGLQFTQSPNMYSHVPAVADNSANAAPPYEGLTKLGCTATHMMEYSILPTHYTLANSTAGGTDRGRSTPNSGQLHRVCQECILSANAINYWSFQWRRSSKLHLAGQSHDCQLAELVAALSCRYASRYGGSAASHQSDR